MNQPAASSPGEAPERLISTAEAAAADRAAEARGLGVDRLMARAGRAVADVAAHQLPCDLPIAVLCGPGNNGGDGYVAAERLATRGRRVAVFAEAPPRTGPAARAAARWAGSLRPLAAFDPEAFGGAIDALYGAGLARPVEGAAAAAIHRLNASEKPVIAVDIPSGISGDCGQALGAAVQADVTVTFFRRKPGHLLWPGREHAGKVILADIGLTEADLAVPARLFHNEPALWRVSLPRPAPDAHKYRRGHVLVASGPALRTGASRLAAIAALNAGAGAVTLAADRAALLIHAAHVTAIMLAEAATPAQFAALLAAGRFGSLAIGPAAGIGAPTRRRIEAALAAGLPMVIDADGISSLVGHLAPLKELARAPLILTPHAGEFARLFDKVLAEDAAFAALPPVLAASKLERARAAARLSGATIVFKGIDTVIAAPDGRAAINDNAGPQLATAGSGDVLAGLAAAHLAGGMDAFEAASAAVWLHGRLGAEIGPGLTAERLVQAVRPARAFI